MATYNWGFDKPFKAAVDLSSYQYRFVSAGSVAGEVTLAKLSACTLGVLQNDPGAGEEATVRILGTSKVMTDCEGSSSPLTVGGLVKSASNGMAQGYNSVTAGSLYAAGVALQAVASGSGVYAEVLLLPYALRS